jgi:hypothetical protein
MQANESLESLLSNYPDGIVTCVNETRQFLQKELHGIREQSDEKAKMIAYSYGRGYKDVICTILLSKSGVKIGIYKGAELPDPHNLLKGSGKVHKFVEVKNSQSLQDPALKVLLDAAVRRYKG